MAITKNPARKKLPTATETAVLIKSARRCPICFHLHGDLTPKLGQIAHLDGDRTNSAEDNLAWLCMPHHSEYDSTTSQHKNYTIAEIKEMRRGLYEAISKGQHTLSISQALSGPEAESPKTRAQRVVAEYIPYMTPKERDIIAYLLAHNQKMFTNTPDGGYANTLISKGIVVCALRRGQTSTYFEMPFEVPDHVWSVLAEHRAEFPYTSPEPSGTAPHPWRVHWMAR